MILSGRSWEAGSGYRYGFNSQEQDDEVYGNGNLNTAEFWNYDARLGRRWNLDLIKKYWESPYAVFTNNPNYFTDYSGLVGEPRNKKPGWKTGLDYRGQSDDQWSESIGIAGDINGPKRKGKENTTSSGPSNPKTPDSEVMKVLVTGATNYSNDELLSIMDDPFEKIKNGQRVMDHWKENTGNPLHTYEQRAYAASSTEYLQLEQIVKQGIRAEYNTGKALTEWDISKLLFAPNFGKTVLYNRDATTILGNTLQVAVLLHFLTITYNYNHQGDTYFTCDFEIIISDWFGVSEQDVTNIDFASVVGGKGLLTMWILQHQRGYKPFIN